MKIFSCFTRASRKVTISAIRKKNERSKNWLNHVQKSSGGCENGCVRVFDNKYINVRVHLQSNLVRFSEINARRVCDPLRPITSNFLINNYYTLMRRQSHQKYINVQQ